MAVSFDGSGDYISYTNAFSFTDFSIACWMWQDDSGSGEEYPVHIGSTTGAANYRPVVITGDNGANIRFAILGNPGSLNTGYIYDFSTWHWVVWTHNNGTGNTIIYVNGVSAVSGAITFNNASNDYLTIGRIRGFAGNNYYGKMAEFSLWDKELAQGEVYNMMHRSLIPDANVLNYSRMDNGADNLAPGGVDVTDYSGNEHHGTFGGNPTWVDGPPIKILHE